MALAVADVAAPCPGDCDGDARVSIGELVLAVGIALDRTALDRCPNLDDDDNGIATVDELVRAVNRAVDGCF
ncbi:MAG TPA: hypothetical protein VL403_11195 [Candidatus Kryptonia bacterium]|nr:hypothetical protein [Candidatus Kryptonia bacterium]